MADITKAPTTKAKSLSISRKRVSATADRYTASWKLPTAATSSDSKSRWTSQHVKIVAIRADGVSIVLLNRSYATSVKSVSVSIDRGNWYPNAVRKLRSVIVTVYGSNSKGNGDASTAKLKLMPPYAPTLSGSFDTDTSIATLSAKVPDTTTALRERYRLKYSMSRTKVTASGSTTTTPKRGTILSYAANTHTLTYNETELGTLGQSDYIKLVWTVYAQGLRGNSAKKTLTQYLAWPEQATIGEPSLKGDIVTVPCGLTNAAEHRVETVTLQYCVTNSTAPTEFQDVGVTDNSYCKALSCAVSDIGTVNPGQHVYFRIKTTRQGRDLYSGVMECGALFVAAPDASTSSDVSVISVDGVSDDPNAIVCTIAWKASASYNSTRVSWSTDAMAWRSTTEPSSFDMADAAWDDGTLSSEWPHHTSVKISGLDEATTYYVRARRQDTDNEGSYTGWSSQASGSTGATPSGISVSVPPSVVAGDDLPVSWSIGGDAKQSRWDVYVDWSIVGSGNDLTSAYSVSAGVLDGKSSVVVSVGATIGGTYSISDSQSVAIVARPQVSVTGWPRTITGEAASLVIECTDPSATITANLVSCGNESDTPNGSRTQYEGDVVWTAQFPAQDGGTSMMPEDMSSLIDGTEYRLEVTASSNGITSDTASPSFELTDEGGEAYTTDRSVVEWAHQAVAPACTISTDGLTATITPTAPDGAVESDTFSVYRVTPTCITEIASDVAFGASVTDHYAPYTHDGSGLSYRVATVTELGDIDWVDVPYVASSGCVRFDWDGRFLELPYDIEVSDDYSKSVDTVRYLDGTSRGYWQDGADMSSSISANIIRFESDQEPTISELARYAGPVFVRTPAGHAYEADVQVNGIDWAADSGTIGVSFKVEAIDNGVFVADVGEV